MNRGRIDQHLDRIDQALAEWQADRDSHADPTIDVLVDLGRLPAEARNYFARAERTPAT